MKFLSTITLLIFSITISYGQSIENLASGFIADLIKNGVDTNGDGLIQFSEAQQTDSLTLGLNVPEAYDGLEGLDNFINLKFLSIWSTEHDTLNVSGFKKLESLHTQMWAVRHIVAEGMENLKTLSTDFGLASISLEGTENLESISTSDNFGVIHDLDYSKLTKLKHLSLHGLPAFRELNLDPLVNLETFFLSYFPIDDHFESITIKNGRHTEISIVNSVDYNAEGTLKYVCTDEEEVNYVKSIFQNRNVNNVEVNTYCSFNKGGNLKKVSGESRIDYDGSGCDIDDPVMPILRYEITDLTTNESEIRTSYGRKGYDGSYEFRTRPGSFRIKPLIDNSDYFSISPEMQEITVTDYESESYLDFCIEPLESKNDVSVGMYPISRARPGFDATYWLGYKNNGNMSSSGEISLNFDNDHLQFVSSSLEAESLDHGEMIWNFDDLQPGEYRYINLKFKLNKPTDAEFALEGDEKLIYNATINSSFEDENLDDNTFDLNQTVVNSFDPNDITCLDGDSISFMETGEYVHYMVRFENTGSAEAVNIVVKDTINTAKFDLESLRPLEGSHPYKTRIKSNGIVEFIFEGINLPYTEEERHGHVIFKIKTKESLIEGDQFENSAAIYFDYNFPIFTNEFETQVVGLALPVKLSRFDAQQIEGDVKVDWHVHSEENLSHYVVERRHENEESFKSVARVNAQNLNEYTSTDNELSASGVYYYRLRMVDNDGDTQLSDVIGVEFHDSDETVLVYPNPATDLFVIENNQSRSTKVVIHNAAGQEITSLTIAENTKQEIDASKFNKGLHFLTFKQSDKLEVKKIFISK